MFSVSVQLTHVYKSIMFFMTFTLATFASSI